MEPLVVPADLESFPGGPFDEDVVEAAAESVRDDAGWHIAPVETETVTVEGDGGRLLLLPSLKVNSVNSVTIDGEADTDWTLLPGARLYRASGWPQRSLVEVAMTHGYENVPMALLPIIAARCQRALVDAVLTQESESIGSRTLSKSYNINRLEVEAASQGLGRYSLPPSFA